MLNLIRSRLFVGLLVLILSTFPTSRIVGGDQLSASFVSDAHRASREAIRTLECRVEFNVKLTPKAAKHSTQSSSGRYWYSVDTLRAKIVEENEELDFLWKNGIRQALFTRINSGKREVAASRGAFSDRHIHRSDAFSRALLVLNIPASTRHVPFEELIRIASKKGKPKKMSIGGRELLMMELSFNADAERREPWIVQVYFDPSVNYLVRKTVHSVSTSSGSLRREEIVDEFNESAPGVYFPVHISGVTEIDGTSWSTQTTQLLDLKVNRPLPAGILDFRFPEGVHLSDGVQGVTYRVDAQGNRISDATPLTRLAPPPPKSISESIPGVETQDEPTSVTQWILPISLGILLLGVLGTFARRRSQQTHKQ
ncbi:MAG: hypothetical protein L0Y72_07985 [Gemmataceae bacterium]|nr:hypothetical protein [Gemmataceae bacterium]MCI0738967.1 hypothetical protein [Gemmataceae bacterium]